MTYKRTWYALLLALSTALSAHAPQQRIAVYLIGDSTMADKEKKAWPETGWGMPFAVFFDKSVTVENHARNGRSTRTFISENRWQPIVDKLQPGDYVFIQFGHNDESKEKTDRYTAPDQYKANLKKFVEETRSKGAQAVLITPVSRRRFNKEGQALQTHEEYSPLVREVAKSMQVPLIDLDEESRALYQQYGSDYSKMLFLQLQPGEHPNYPDGKNDNTHFSELGARLIAQLVLKEVKTLHLGLADHVYVPEKK